MGLRHRDVNLAHAARERLDQQAMKPPRFSQLARDIGMNQKSLKEVFRRVFGTTMEEYCVHKRMRLAQALLLEGQLTIGQIAERVGYSHQSSFAAAFSRYSGMAPKEYKRQRAAIDIPLGNPNVPASGRVQRA